MFYLFKTCSPAGRERGGARSLGAQGGRSAWLSSEHTQLRTGPSHNSTYVKSFHWRCLNICFFSLCGLWHPPRKQKITFFLPFPSVHPNRLSGTGSGAAHRNLSPIPGSPLGQLHTSTAAHGSVTAARPRRRAPLCPACLPESPPRHRHTFAARGESVLPHHTPQGKATRGPADRLTLRRREACGRTEIQN